MMDNIIVEPLSFNGEGIASCRILIGINNAFIRGNCMKADRQSAKLSKAFSFCAPENVGI
jgi:hypothetical protein